MLTIENLTVRVAGRLLIDDASVRVPAGSRTGLVGRNGTGKTTLFNVITGDLASESGSLRVRQRARVGRLLQEAPSGPDSLIDIVLAADRERASLLAEAEHATDADRIAEIHTRLADIDAHSAPARAAAILSGLGFSTADQARAVSEFSGGWRMRVALAATLFAEPDLLLLDEPTNYLDLEGTLWLEDHLARYPHTVLVISHDRDLLDNAVDSILHLENGKLTFYRGGYSSFERQRRERQMLDAKFAKKQEAQRKHLQAFVDRFRAKASKARQAQSRLKMLAKLEPASAMVSDDVRPIVLPAPDKTLSPPILALDGVSVGYEPGKPVLRNLSLRIDDDDRIALLGANGNGKSTLVKLLAERLAPMGGSITRADKLRTAYFAQHQLDELRPKDSVYDHVRRLMPDEPEAKVRAKAGAIGFSAQRADAAVETLSGGEKARLMLGLATFGGPHLVILDEPTNHLDIDSRAALIEAINDYPGAVILVSHDRYLLEASVDRLWIVQNGGVSAYDGDLDDYRRLILSGEGSDTRKGAAAKDAAPKAGTESRKNSAQKRSELAALRKRVSAAEVLTQKLHARIEQLDATLATLFASDPVKAGQLARERADAADRLAEAEEEWLNASAELEAASL
ncbi:ABC-F family ATP-binding cassette domain-containing protein [Pseudorhodoplanes sp.]|uniref:ABC-F family ATP-binding cassette domain-containing protein n=1 Tax=Pseudorhodoplanes sp. TaxID=1934341 RepID=UPI002D13AA86|nr:ABC-F family ATP-binding cassette domain-containing protein [Pseudorhodoplanes sp.]HWV53508.1 ABC-F family ATP-binding cassette domain-containing protein [Pseudorhodoplanes sp.]